MWKDSKNHLLRALRGQGISAFTALGLLTLGRELFQALAWEGDVDEELRRLRARKATEFAWEPRLVAGVKVERRGDMMHFLAASVLA